MGILGRFFGRRVLDDGLIDYLDRAVVYLRHAIVTFYDGREDPFLEKVLYDTIGDLAEVLMLTHSPARADNLANAVELYRIAAHRWRPTQPDSALTAEVMAVLGSVLTDPDSETPLDADLTDLTRRDLRDTEKMATVVESLLGYAERLAYIARRTERSVYKDACLAADLVQVLVERAAADGHINLEKVLEFLTLAFDTQLGMQRGYYGLAEQKRDAGVRAFANRFPRTDTMPTLVFLRPLGTSRRIHVDNAFGPYYRDLFAALGPAPQELTLEGALHLAFMMRFRTEALGGPIDMLGMARSTALFKFQGSALEAWQEAVALMIASAAVVVVLLEDSAGLLWEMSEIARQRARGKVIVVVLPSRRPDCGESNGSSFEQVRALGFALPAKIMDDSFLLLNSSGAVDQKLDFAALWNGELLTAALTKAGSR